jgi:hypothetical protein
VLEPDLPGTGVVEGTIEGLAVSDYKEGTVDSGLGRRAGKARGRKLVALVAVAASALIGLFYLAGYTLEWHRASVARSLLGELKRLEVGKTTEAQIRKLSDQYAGKYSPANLQNQILQPASFEIIVRNPYIMIANSARALPGRRSWGFVVTLVVERGYLSELYLGMGVYRSDGLGLESKVRLTDGTNLQGDPEAPYYVSEAHITGPPGEALVVWLGPTATTEEREKGFGFNFSCLTAFRECRHVCQTMPSAWRDLTLQPNSQGRMMNEDGRPVNDYRECGKGTP